jgi:hypothetical protein
MFNFYSTLVFVNFVVVYKTCFVCDKEIAFADLILIRQSAPRRNFCRRGS